MEQTFQKPIETIEPIEPIETPETIPAAGMAAEKTAASELSEPRYILSISENVVEKIASLAARKVDGIVDMKGNVFSLIQETFGANVKSKGVNANVSDNGEAHVELSIITEYGKSAVEIFEGLKEIINEDVAHMTGLRITRLVVNVVDVMDAGEIADKRRKETEAAEADSVNAGDIVTTSMPM